MFFLLGGFIASVLSLITIIPAVLLSVCLFLFSLVMSVAAAFLLGSSLDVFGFIRDLIGNLFAG